jgi:catechol 2,3-dioxygenase-like lactoylglutathione lyase family enzyme
MEKSQASQPAANLSGEKIVQFSLVVSDAEKVAKRFSEVFGIPWTFYELKPDEVVLDDQVVTRADCRLKVGLTDFGGRSLKLIQPVSGSSSYAEFLEESGEGFYTLGFGTLVDYELVLSGLKKAGVGIEMQADAGNGSTFSIMDTAQDLGCRIEFSSPARHAGESPMKLTGILVPDRPAIVDMNEPIFCGGKKINQVGLVVADEKKAAKRFEQLLGIEGWRYAYGPPGLTGAFLDEQPVPASAMESLDVAFANGWLGDIQIEIIRPVGIRPGGCHQRFLDRRGNGIQHLSFGLEADYHAMVDGMKQAGIGAEFSVSIAAAGVSVTYLATQSQLGGFQLEIAGKS